MDAIHFWLCIGNGESIDKPRLTKLAAELLPPLQEKHKPNNARECFISHKKSPDQSVKYDFCFLKQEHILCFVPDERIFNNYSTNARWI